MTEEEINKQYPSLEERLVYKVKESLIFGVSLLLIGTILGLVHLVARRSIETHAERVDILRRVYLFAGLLVFAVASIISLTVAIPETLSYMFIGARPGDEYLSPGEPLSIAIISLPVWILYLYLTLRNIKSSKTEA
jgi:vacuolar-type H+-ATPase subunit I/STV1